METSTRRGLPRAMVDDVFLAPVHINAGGTIYTTTLNTLTKYPESKLAKLFDGTLTISIDPISRHYFLDVNGSVFAHVLDFLRYGELLLPDDFTQLPLLTKLAEFFGIQEMLESLTDRGGRQEKTSQNDSDEDNRVQARTRRRGKFTNIKQKDNNTTDKLQNIVNNNESTSANNKDIGRKNIDTKGVQLTKSQSTDVGPMKIKSLDVEAIKSETSELVKVKAKMVEADTIKSGTIEVGAIKSEITEMVSIGAVNVEMTSVDAREMRTKSLEVGTLMAMALEIGTLKVGNLETEATSGPVKVVLVRYDEYYKIIDVYSTDELTLLNPMFPLQSLRSEYMGNCNRLSYKFADLPCNNPQTTYKFGVPYLLHLFKQLLNKGYRFSSVITAGELNYTRDYVLIHIPSTNPRP